MGTQISRPADSYSPLYFLASVGAGGLAVSFFMYLMFWVPHPGRPVPIYEDITAAFAAGALPLQFSIVAALIGIAIFAFLNLRYLVWNIGESGRFSTSDRGRTLMATNAETQMLARPLAFAMTINVGFILGLVFVPGLWGVVEYLFPLALIAFSVIGIMALRQMGAFVGRVLTKGGFDCKSNNSFAQLLPAFALAMVGVGLSAPASMSTTALTAGVSVILSTLFLVAAVLVAVLALVLGIRAMMENGANAESAPTLMIVVPLMTVLGILILRQNHGLHIHFGSETSAGDMLSLLTKFLAVQIVFLLFGLTVLRRQGYAQRFLTGSENSPGSYALVCPGVGLSVMLHFWVNKGLVDAGLIAKFGAAYWVLSGVAIAAQIAMVVLVVHLNRRHFSGRTTAPAMPAE